MTETLFESDLRSLRRRHRGKVRDIYDVDERHMLIVTTDRLSAFDVVLPTPIPGKGVLLTRLSNFWFARTRRIIPNHLADLPLDKVLKDPVERQQVEGRAIMVKKAQGAAGRGHRAWLSRRQWLEGIQKVRHGLRDSVAGRSAESRSLPQPIFTPSTKPMSANTTRTSASTRLPNCWGRRWPRSSADRQPYFYKDVAAWRADARHHHCRHQVRIQLDETGTLDAD